MAEKAWRKQVKSATLRTGATEEPCREARVAGGLRDLGGPRPAVRRVVRPVERRPLSGGSSPELSSCFSLRSPDKADPERHPKTRRSSNAQDRGLAALPVRTTHTINVCLKLSICYSAVIENLGRI